MNVGINILFRLLSTLFGIEGLFLLFKPSLFSYLGFSPSGIDTTISSPFNQQLLTPSYYGFFIALSCICGYAATFKSLHDKSKVARSLFYVFVGILHALVNDCWHGKTQLFQSLQSAYVHGGIVAALGVWNLIACFASTSDDVQPKKNVSLHSKHATTTAINNIYFRSLALLWAIQGSLLWFFPKYIPTILGVSITGHELSSKTIMSDWSLIGVGSLGIACSTLAFYSSTFSSKHSQAKIARGFFLYWLLFLIASWQQHNHSPQLSDVTQMIHLVICTLAFIGSTIVSFSAYEEDTEWRRRAGKQATAKAN